MGWRDLGKLAKDWLEQEKVQQLSADRRKVRSAEDAQFGTERQLKRAAQAEVGYAAAEALLPPKWSAMVTASRPENIAARRDAQRRETLAGRPGAELSLQVSGDLTGIFHGQVSVDVETYRAEEPGEMSYLRLVAEAADPIPFGNTAFGSLVLLVPHLTGPGHYDLCALHRQVEAGELAGWEPTEPAFDAGGDDGGYCWDPSTGVGTIAVADGSVEFDLGMVDSGGRIRITGRLDH